MKTDQRVDFTFRFSEGTKVLLRDIVADLSGSRLGPKIDRLIELLEAGVHIPDLGFINAKLDLIQGLIENEGPIANLTRKVDEFMANQEQRLQAIATKIDEVLSDLATLKENNPQIEDEISAIESKLSIASPTGGGDTGTGTGGSTEG